MNEILIKNFDELIIDISQVIIENDDLIDNNQLIPESETDIIRINMSTLEKNKNPDEFDEFDENSENEEPIDD